MPDPFRIIIDTREQRPYTFECETVNAALPAGDYSVEGWENKVAVERKSLADFARTVIHEMDRFRSELMLLAICVQSCIVVEADLDELLRGRLEVRGDPHSIMGAALWILNEYRIPTFWCGSRQASREFTEMFLRMFVRKQMGDERMK